MFFSANVRRWSCCLSTRLVWLMFRCWRACSAIALLSQARVRFRESKPHEKISSCVVVYMVYVYVFFFITRAQANSGRLSRNVFVFCVVVVSARRVKFRTTGCNGPPVSCWRYLRCFRRFHNLVSDEHAAHIFRWSFYLPDSLYDLCRQSQLRITALFQDFLGLPENELSCTSKAFPRTFD